MINIHEWPYFLSLREAAGELGVNRTWLAGAIAGARIELTPIGQSKVVKRADLEGLRSIVPRRRTPQST